MRVAHAKTQNNLTHTSSTSSNDDLQAWHIMAVEAVVVVTEVVPMGVEVDMVARHGKCFSWHARNTESEILVDTATIPTRLMVF